MENKSNSAGSQEEHISQLNPPEWVSRKYREDQRRMNMQKKTKKVIRRKKRRYDRLIILILLLIVMTAGFIYAYNSIGDTQDNAPTVAGHTDAVNIMLLGVDKREGDAGRSDTLMVLTYDAEIHKGALLSLPRDTRVHIEGSGYDKINHAYAYGGHELSQKTVESFLNVPMNYYIIIDIHAFEKIIDAVGGIDIDVEKRMYYEDPWDDDGGLVIDLQPGMQHMDGKTAIQYVRYRDGEGDIGRIQRQQKFMKAFLAQVISPSILPKLPDVFKSLSDAIETNMPLDEMLSLISDLPAIQQNGLASDMVPGKPAYIKDVSYWLPDIEQTRSLIAKNMGIQLDEAAQKDTQDTIAAYTESLPKGLKMGSISDETNSAEPDEKQPAHEVQNGDITVLVINNSGIDGAGAQVADTLKKKGFKISSVETGSSASQAKTTITANKDELDCFYGMPFPCTIMEGGSTGQATVRIGLDYEQ